jgi:hypothetical protein
MVGSREGNGVFGKRSRRWVGNTRINVHACPDGKGCGTFDWRKLAQNSIQQRFLVYALTS